MTRRSGEFERDFSVVYARGPVGGGFELGLSVVLALKDNGGCVDDG